MHRTNKKAGFSLAILLMILAIAALIAFMIISAAISRHKASILSANKENARKAVHAAVMQQQTDKSAYMCTNALLSESIFQCSYDTVTQTISPDITCSRDYDITSDIASWSDNPPEGTESSVSDIWYVGIESDGTILLAGDYSLNN